MIQPTNDPLALIAEDAEDMRKRVVAINSFTRHLTDKDLFGHLRSRFMAARERLHKTSPVDLRVKPAEVARLCRSEAASLLWVARQLEEQAKG